MNFLNYLFYRVCRQWKENGDKKPLVTGVLFVSLVVFCLTPIAWGNLLFFLVGEVNMIGLIIYSSSIFFILYPYYKKKEKEIFKQFRDSTLNKIPYWCFLPIFFICMVVGFYIYSKTKHFFR